ncbi:AraC family transcriptional regulator [Temperatibacter marinus]|uniref:AraC family transcriptional regulator n=1 Tax=Temperatibacter marinus TaxID=1456591 RepID=A0AA52EJV5_9PROT|nr:AraC family transcriptional regulator [Temperatibacter marinus]WND03852.1 AraC family transcriptional regulator [Temperatibacter marinus]
MTDEKIALDQAIKSYPIEQIFDCLSDTVFFIKDRRGRYAVSNNTLALRCGLNDKSLLIGKTPSELMGKAFGKRYEAQDNALLRKGVAVVDQLELHLFANQTAGWCITNKKPLLDKDGKVIGIVGISQDLKQPDLSHSEMKKLTGVIEFVQDNLSLPPTVESLTKVANLSRFQLDLRMQRIFGLTAGQWILKQRIEEARKLLMYSAHSLVDVAMQVGYSDQSTFTRQFRKTTGMTPLKFRRSSL